MNNIFELDVGGRKLKLETGLLAEQAGGSVLVTHGETVLLVTATMQDPREGIDFFPLLVDYEERMYAIGRIPGSWFKREGRPTESAILSARLIDRTLRPLFPDGFRNDVQVVTTVLSVDHDNPADIAAMIGASAALAVSDIPFTGPVGAVRVGRIDGELIANPTGDQSQLSDLDLVIGASDEAVIMVEAAASELSEEEILRAIAFGHEEIKKQITVIKQMSEAVGKQKHEVILHHPSEKVDSWVREHTTDALAAAIQSDVKQIREEQMNDVKERLHAAYRETFGDEAYNEDKKDVSAVYDNILKEQVRRMITEDQIRPDGRAPGDIRALSSVVGLLPRVHGTGLFQRGQTQVLTTCTLGLKSDEQIIDDLGEEDRKRYIHHYNFPGYSVGETRPMRSPGRREIGHGALAERALLPVIPSEEEFPYTMRLVSEVLSSNGSSSQASVCGSTLALMDAGVPIKRPVAGIAMGLVKLNDRFAILSDIQGIEDALGDMDFKVAGTSEGITAIQMDIKISGIGEDILTEALEQAKHGRLHILDSMAKTIDSPRPEMSSWAPRITTLQIDVDKIRDIIGPGGKMIRKIVEESGVQIDVEDDGKIFIASTDQKGTDTAVSMIENLTKEVEVGAVYKGTVKRIMNFGAFVEVLPGKEGLVHISKLAHERVGKVEDVVNVGDVVEVKVTEIDSMGRVNLSRKDLLPRPAHLPEDDGEGNGAPRYGGDRSRERGRGGSGRGQGGQGGRTGYGNDRRR